VVKKVITHVHTWEGKIFLFEDVPADVCQQCGETYFSPDVLEAMDQIVASDREPKTRVAVPVFSIADAVQ
jgi:YgiT-type zinc finger domain-containing protein